MKAHDDLSDDELVARLVQRGIDHYRDDCECCVPTIDELLG